MQIKSLFSTMGLILTLGLGGIRTSMIATPSTVNYQYKFGERAIKCAVIAKDSVAQG